MDTPSHLSIFYGKECPHCEKMLRVVKELEKSLAISVNKFEIWHDKENMKMMEALDNGSCGGVPFFFNEKTHKTICGEATLNELKQWAK
jgi:glutaredoxin